MRNWLFSCAILLAVTLALRLGLAKRLGPTLRYAIWLPVLIRLLLPVGIGAAGWSVANWGLETEPTQSTSIIQNEPQATPDLSGADIAFTPDHFTGETTPGTPGLLPTLWVVGAILVGGWFLYVEFALALRLFRTRERVEGTGSFLPVYVTDAIPSPCLFGLVRPAIYLTPDVLDDEETLRHVLAHEETHFRHGDLIWSLLRGVCLAVHWFDPPGLVGGDPLPPGQRNGLRRGRDSTPGRTAKSGLWQDFAGHDVQPWTEVLPEHGDPHRKSDGGKDAGPASCFPYQNPRGGGPGCVADRRRGRGLDLSRRNRGDKALVGLDGQ